MSQIIKVGMADMNVCRVPDSIATLGLGSCVGIVLYEPYAPVCGMVHIMLPNSNAIKNNDNPAKFADTGIKLLAGRLTAMGLQRSKLRAKIAGGAKMFRFTSASDMLKVGERNAEAVRAVLQSLSIPIMAEDCGGDYGRTIEFDPKTAALQIRAIGRPDKII